MTFCSTSVANLVFNLDEGALVLLLVLLSINGLLEWKSWLCGLLDGPYSTTGLYQSDRSGLTSLTGLVRPERLRIAVNHMPYFPTTKAQSVF